MERKEYDMKKQNRVLSLLSLILMFTMLVSCLMGITLVTGAEEGEETEEKYLFQ